MHSVHRITWRRRIATRLSAGLTWTAQTNDATGRLLAVDFFDSAHGIAVGDGGLTARS